MCLFAMISLRVCPRSVLPERVDLSSALTDTIVCEFGNSLNWEIRCYSFQTYHHHHYYYYHYHYYYYYYYYY